MLDYRTIIVCGSRDGQGPGVVDRGMRQTTHHLGFDHVVVGSFRGTDREVFLWAITQERDATVMPAHWKYGKRTGPPEGPIRNRRMPARWPDFLALFAFPGGDGTADMTSVALGLQKPVYEWRGDAWRMA